MDNYHIECQFFTAKMYQPIRNKKWHYQLAFKFASDLGEISPNPAQIWVLFLFAGVESLYESVADAFMSHARATNICQALKLILIRVRSRRIMVSNRPKA